MASQRKLPPDEIISLADAAEMYGFDQDYLRQLAYKGRLKAKKIGNIWTTTPKYMEEYITSRKKTGQYRDDIGP